MVDDLQAHVASLRRYAYMLCRNHSDADDLVQETLVKAIAAADSYDSTKSLRIWLFTILYNSFISNQRQYMRRARAASFLAVHDEASHPPDQERQVEVQQIMRMMGRLTPEQQSVMILVAVEGLSYEEAAAVIGVPSGTVMSRLARGREQLRRLVHGDNSSYLRIVR